MRKFSMLKKSTSSYLPVLLVEISKETEERLLKDAIIYRSDASSLGKVFRKMLKKHIRNQKFPHIINAPENFLLSSLKEQWLKSDEITFITLLAWQQSQTSLFEELAPWLEEKLNTAPNPYVTEGEVTQSADTALAEWATEFCASNDGPDPEYVKIALATLIQKDKLPVIEETAPDGAPSNNLPQQDKNQHMHPQSSDPLSEAWHAALQQLETALPANYTLEEVEEFLQAVRALATRRLEAQAHAQRCQSLQEKLTPALELIDQEKTYFNFTRHADWQIAPSPAEIISTIEELLSQLQAEFALRSGLKKQLLNPPSREERKKMSGRLDECEEQIQFIYDQIADTFSGNQIDSLPSLENEPAALPEPELPAPTQFMPEPQPTETAFLALASAQLTESRPPAEKPSDPTIDQSLIEEGPLPAPEPEFLPVETIAVYDTSWLEEPAPEPEENILPESAETALPVSDVKVQDVQAHEAQQESEEELTPEKTAQILHTARQSAITASVSGDYARAYWLSQVLESQNQTPGLPAWALASVQAMRWLLQGWPSLSESLKNEIREVAQPAHRTLADGDEAYAGLAIAMVMTLFERGMGWENWLLSVDAPENLPHLHALLQRLDEFTRSNLTLEPALVINVLGKEQLSKHISTMSEKARAWLEYAPVRRSRFDGAVRTWERIVKKDEELVPWLEPVIQNDGRKLEWVRAGLKNWSDDVFLDDYIQKTYQHIVGKSKNIEGEARDQLIRWIKESADITREWCEAVEAQKNIQQRQWNIEQTSILVAFSQANLPLVVGELQQALKETEAPSIGLAILLHLITDLYGCFQTNQSTTGKEPESWKTYDPKISLQENLAKPLFLYPALSLTAQGALASEEFGILSLRIMSRPLASPEEAYTAWIQKRDYRFLNRLAKWISPEREDFLLRRKKNSLDDDLAHLEKEREETTISIEQVWVEGLISQEDYIQHSSSVASIHKQSNRLLEKDTTQANLPDFNQALQKLLGIRKSLYTLRDHRREKQEEKWQALLTDMPRFLPESEMHTHISTLVGRLLRNNDLRTMEELLNLLADIQNNIKSPDSLKKYIYQEKRPRQKLRDFHKSLPEMARALEKEALSFMGKTYSERLPRERQAEVNAAIQSWLSLKKSGQGLHVENFNYVAQIMRYLGWEISSPSPVSRESSVPQGFQRWKVKAKPLVDIPIPQFGSERGGIYDVIGAWERPATDLIQSLSNSLGGNRPFILLYFGRMLPNQRVEFRHLTRKNQLPILLVDELLLLFLAREYYVRLTTLLECSLPYAYINPYVPGATANVPPEMFFGRVEERNKLKDMYGPSIVYGGRQLGKSALLKQVQREFHRPHEREYAIYEDIRLIGSPASGRDYEQELLDRLLTVLGRENLLPANTRHMDLPHLCDELITYIIKEDARVLLLLDETDNLLETDSKRHFFVVSQLKRVMDQTNRRFKAVYAGLHHVLQFTNIGNQPLSHMGSADAIQIGPMEQDAAIELIKRPLESLGYIFSEQEHEDLSLPLLIFSYTNYHPSLLQLFGQHLVDSLRERPAGRNTLLETQPYLITREDIEAVYRNRDVRATILERFNITLALDERYEAIALSLILEQLAERNGFDRLFTPQELLQIIKSNWLKGFSHVSDRQFADLLNEMCGLGVLASIESDTVRYRLRSPNLVYLLGTEDQIELRLLSISKKEGLDKEHILDAYHHSEGDTSTFDYSPLTYQQEGAIQGKRSGVCLVFGSSATRIYSLESAVRGMVQRQQGKLLNAGVSARTGLAIKQQLNNFAQLNRTEKFLVIYRELSGSAQDMFEQVAEASRFCKHFKEGERKIRIIFEINEQNAWEWFQIPREERLQLERLEAEVLNLERWNIAGIRQVLELSKSDLLPSDKHLETIYGISQGWPVLLEPLGLLSQQESNMDTLILKYSQATDEKSNILKFIQTVDPDLAVFVTNMVNTLRVFSDNEPDLHQTTMDGVLELMSESAASGGSQRFMDYLERMCILRFEPPFIDKAFVKMWNEHQQ